jgi:hypothetical protein
MVKVKGLGYSSEKIWVRVEKRFGLGLGLGLNDHSLIFQILVGVGLGSVYLLPWSMLPDVIGLFGVSDRTWRGSALCLGQS